MMWELKMKTNGMMMAGKTMGLVEISTPSSWIQPFNRRSFPLSCPLCCPHLNQHLNQHLNHRCRQHCHRWIPPYNPHPLPPYRQHCHRWIPPYNPHPLPLSRQHCHRQHYRPHFNLSWPPSMMTMSASRKVSAAMQRGRWDSGPLTFSRMTTRTFPSTDVSTKTVTPSGVPVEQRRKCPQTYEA